MPGAASGLAPGGSWGRGFPMVFHEVLSLSLERTVMLPLLGSVVAGGLIGMEREAQGKPAGLRTHMLVCFASALMTLAALQMGDWARHLPAGTQIVSDMARMPHAILTGIGFLCAGVIFREGLSVQGLTTAASLWMTAAIGITFGTGLVALAILSALLTIAILVIARLSRHIAPAGRGLVLEVAVDAESPLDGARLAAILSGQGIRPDTPTLSWDRSGAVRRYRMLAAARTDRLDVEALARAFHAEPAVRAVTIAPVENDAISG